MTAVLKFLAGLLSVLKVALGLMERKKLRQEGADAQAQVQREQVIENVEIANEARADVERDIALHPDSVYDDDGFKRPST